jgi:hypothetical protein
MFTHFHLLRKIITASVRESAMVQQFLRRPVRSAVTMKQYDNAGGGGGSVSHSNKFVI